MLQQIREFAGRKFVRWLFIIFLVVPFGLFGIDAYINRVSTTDARCGTIPEYQRAQSGFVSYGMAFVKTSDVTTQWTKQSAVHFSTVFCR